MALEETVLGQFLGDEQFPIEWQSTDAGGVSSHPAVLSREFGIPAVVGSSVATSVIKSGDRIRVDGDKGVVEVQSPRSSQTSTGS